jgi:hypothetical protein
MGHLQTCPAQDNMSASPLKADIIGRERDVRYGPKAEYATSGHGGSTVDCLSACRKDGKVRQPLTRGRKCVKALRSKVAQVGAAG